MQIRREVLKMTVHDWSNWSIFKQYTALSLRLPALSPTQDFWRKTRMFVTHEPKVNDFQTSRVKINLKQFLILYRLMIQLYLLLKRIMVTISETWIRQGWIQNVKFLGETSSKWFGGEANSKKTNDFCRSCEFY